MQKKIILLILICVAMFFISCDQKRDAFGSYYHVFVLTPSTQTSDIEPFFDTYAQVIRITPQTEKVFTYHFVDSIMFDKYLDRRNLVIATSLDAPGYTGKLARQMLSEEAKKLVEDEGVAFFMVEEPWANNQTLAFFVGSNLEMLQASVELNGEQYAYILDQRITSQLQGAVLSERFRWREKKVEKEIEKAYGFHIGVPHGYVWEAGKAEDNFIWLRHLVPEQWIFVHRAPITERAVFDSVVIDSLNTSLEYELDGSIYFNYYKYIDIRDSLCSIYYESDEIDSIVSVERDLEIGGLPAWRIRGLWKNSKNVLGGPFVSYVAFDYENNTRYVIDAAIFAPGTSKEKYLRQVHAALLSFNPIHD